MGLVATTRQENSVIMVVMALLKGRGAVLGCIWKEGDGWY